MENIFGAKLINNIIGAYYFNKMYRLPVTAKKPKICRLHLTLFRKRPSLIWTAGNDRA